jgi:3-dehydroquinate dehydratase-2
VVPSFHQSHLEGALIALIHRAHSDADAIMVNTVGLSFHSVAMLDAFDTFDGPGVEIHILNIHARGEAHRHSLLPQAVARLVGSAPEGLPEPVRKGPA